MNNLRVRVYNVGFGDAVLISVPDRGPDGKTIVRHILIDVGNVLAKEGGDDSVFEPIIRNVLKVLNGQPLDLYIMTHEHMDHVQGLPYAAFRLGLELNVNYTWLTASAEGDAYYERYPEAKRKRLAFADAYQDIEHYLAASPSPMTDPLSVLMLNNNPRSTQQCVSYLRSLGRCATSYVYRGLTGKHPFQEAQLAVWGPEENTGNYYQAPKPMGLNQAGENSGKAKPLPVPAPPIGVDAGVFYDLVESRWRNYIWNLMAIDGAANNTSVVFCLEWRGWRLLFPGDAEDLSWCMMDRQGMLKPVHFLKVSHHGSRNGIPRDALLEKILPITPPDNRPRRAIISAQEHVYDGVPNTDYLKQKLRKRCRLWSTEGLQPGAYKDFEFEDLTPQWQVMGINGDDLRLDSGWVHERVKQFAPVLKFGKGEFFFPMNAARYVSQCSLHFMSGKREQSLVLPPGYVKVSDLQAFKDKEFFLVNADEDFVDKTQAKALAEYLDQQRQGLGLWGIDLNKYVKEAYQKILEVGVVTTRRIASVATRGKLPKRIFNRALELYGGIKTCPPVYHYHYMPKEKCGGKYDVLEYWFFYAYNDWATSHKGINDHEGDWEAVLLYFHDLRDSEPAGIAYTTHSNYEWKTWSQAEQTGDCHTIVYVAPGCHANFPTKQTNLMDGELPWVAGDIVVGEGLAWDNPINLDGLSWVDEFRGRWGARYKWVDFDPVDKEKLGGSPTGPRYAPDGGEREKWCNPVGWARL